VIYEKTPPVAIIGGVRVAITRILTSNYQADAFHIIFMVILNKSAQAFQSN
jgi:hypothetical protein